MDAEFRDIFELSCEKGFRAIIDEAEWHLTIGPDARAGFVENLAALSNHYERAMVTFLDHNQFWKDATRFYHADTLPYWRKRKNLPHRPAAVDDTSLRELASLIRNYFHQPRAGATIAWWSPSAGANWIISLPAPRTIRSKASNG